MIRYDPGAFQCRVLAAIIIIIIILGLEADVLYSILLPLGC